MRSTPNPLFTPSKEGKLSITKIDAAVRQLETAITLWFFDGDPVSTCTLSFASYEIITQLNAGFEGTTPTMLTGRGVRPEYKKAVIQLIKSAPNFFKHGGKDPHETHFYSAKGIVGILADAVLTYRTWQIGKRPIFEVFIAWLRFSEPKLFPKSPPEIGVDSSTVEIFLKEGKQQFFNESLPFMTRQLSGVK